MKHTITQHTVNSSSSYTNCDMNFLCLSINGVNGLQLLNCESQHVLRTFKNAVIVTYPFGILEELVHTKKVPTSVSVVNCY